MVIRFKPEAREVSKLRAVATLRWGVVAVKIADRLRQNCVPQTTFFQHGVKIIPRHDADVLVEAQDGVYGDEAQSYMRGLARLRCER